MKKKRARNRVPRCPYCGSPGVLRSANGIYKDNLQNAMLYVCKRYPVCDAYVRVHPGTRLPMGTLATGSCVFSGRRPIGTLISFIGPA